MYLPQQIHIFVHEFTAVQRNRQLNHINVVHMGNTASVCTDC